jgi:threonyl-tRNA synthetase
MDKEKLHNLRHSLAHLLAAAVQKSYPDAKPTLGPAIDDGFYYDFEFSSPVGTEDLKGIEKDMKKLLNSWTEFTHEEKTPEDAKKYYKDNEYKLELIDEIVSKGEKITFYTCGEFTDLCRGGHLENPSKEIDAKSFKLDRVAGAYWRGDENNKMLTRIYGLAFESKDELGKYLEQREEAKKRDHKKLGKELDLFLSSELVGPGLPLFTPKGTIIRDELDSFIWELRQKIGYERVDIPHITKKELYLKSGHWSKFEEDLFRIKTREGHEFALKPMNCPHHTQIYARKPWSYKDLPKRYASTTKVYRDEQTGELGGLSRVRSITQDDAHVFCRMQDAEEEMGKIYDIVKTFYGAFGFKLNPTLSLHDPDNMDNYLGDEKIWIKAEEYLRKVIKKNESTVEEVVGEAAFYGPKIDFMAKDAIGRKHQVATIQLDMNMPESFDLTCTNESGDKERIVMIHAAIMGSIERFMSVLIEHLGGVFPVWLAPVQVSILPISEKQADYAKEVYETLKEGGVRVELDDSAESLGKRIRTTKMQKIPYTVVIGDKEKESKKLTVETRKEKLEDVPPADFLTKVQKETKDRTLN